MRTDNLAARSKNDRFREDQPSHVTVIERPTSGLGCRNRSNYIRDAKMAKAYCDLEGCHFGRDAFDEPQWELRWRPVVLDIGTLRSKPR
jgi:hypothetical protein